MNLLLFIFFTYYVYAVWKEEYISVFHPNKVHEPLKINIDSGIIKININRRLSDFVYTIGTWVLTVINPWFAIILLMSFLPKKYKLHIIIDAIICVLLTTSLYLIEYKDFLF